MASQSSRKSSGVGSRRFSRLFVFSICSLFALWSLNSYAEQALISAAAHVCEGKLMGDICEYTDEQGTPHHGVCDNQFGTVACGLVSEHGMEPVLATGDISTGVVGDLALPLVDGAPDTAKPQK